MGNEATWLRFVYVEQETRQRFAQKCMRNEIVAAKLTRTHTHHTHEQQHSNINVRENKKADRQGME